ncbi:MAG TPA: site-2 protease family protein [Candidatus Acidoferrales bacterium]
MDTLVCPSCRALVHGEKFERISTAADRLEKKSQFGAAREVWLQALPLLPPSSEHAEWIQRHSDELANRPVVSDAKSKWAKRLGPLGPVAVMAAKAKTLLLALSKFKFLLSLVAFVAVYWAVFGAKFGIGFAALILIHEMGHFIDVKRRGLPAEMPVFLPGLGAYVKWKALGVSTETRAAVSLAGPLAGWIASMVCLAIWWKTGDSLWAGLARVSAWLNVLNLIPVWILDGGTAVGALGRTERFLISTAGVALWLVLGETVFFLVAAGAAFRAFTKDVPEKSSSVITAYYLAVMISLGAVLYFVPGQILPTR